MVSLVKQHGKSGAQQVQANNVLIYAWLRVHHDLVSGSNKKSDYILPNQKGFLGSETMRTAQIHYFRRGGRNGSCADCDVRTAVTGYELWKGETRPDAKAICDIGKHALCQAQWLGTTLTQL